MTLKEFYTTNYPTDELGEELNDRATFSGLLNTLYHEGDVYSYIGQADSVIRERLFARLAEELDEDYNYVYQLWLSASDEI